MGEKLFDYGPRIYSKAQLENEVKKIVKASNRIDDSFSDMEPEVVMDACQTIIDSSEKISLSFRKLALQYDEELNEAPLFFEDEIKKRKQKGNIMLSKKFKKVALSNINVSCSYNKGVLEITLPYLHRTVRTNSKIAYVENYSLAEKTQAVMREFSNKNKIDLWGIFKKPLKMEIERYVLGEKRIPDLANIGVEQTVDVIFSEIGRSDGCASLVELNYKTIQEKNIDNIKTKIRLFEVD